MASRPNTSTQKRAPAAATTPPVTRPAVPRKTAKAAATPKPATSAAPKPTTPKKEKEKKPKLVRDSFTIPKAEFAAIEALKARAIAQGQSVKKSELLRAGLKALSAMGDAAFKAALAAVPTLKTGRPVSQVKADKR